MKRILVVIFSLLISYLGHSQVTGYSYTLKVGPANNQVSVYAKPTGSGYVKWTQLEFVVGFQTSAGVPTGTWATSSSLNSMFGIPYVLTADNKGTSISPTGYSYDSYSLNFGPGVASMANVTDGTEYLIGTITYSLPGGTSFVPYLLDFADGGSTGDGNTYIGTTDNGGTYYTPTYGNASFYGAADGGYQNKGSQLVDLGSGNSAAKPSVVLLPITISKYDVQNSGCNDVLVKWEVADAKNFDHFEVERATDGKNFKKIGTVAFDNKQSSYSFTDKDLADGSYQYRLRNVDIDGKFKIEPSKSVIVKCSKDKRITVLPTITNSNISVKGLEGAALVKVFSTGGQLVIEKQNVSAGDKISVNGLPAGAYVVQVIQRGNIVLVTTIVKQ